MSVRMIDLDLDNTNCARPHRDFPQQVQVSQASQLWGQYSRGTNSRLNLLRGILLVDIIDYYCYHQERGTVTIRANHASLAMVSEAGPPAMVFRVFEVIRRGHHRAQPELYLTFDHSVATTAVI